MTIRVPRHRAGTAPGAAVLLLLAASCGNGEPAFSPPEPPDVARLSGLVDASGEAAIRDATEGVNAALRSPDAWAALGQAYEIAGMYAESESAYCAAFGLAPTEPRHAYRAAISANRQGQTRRALEHLDAVLESAPDYGPAWRRKGGWHLDLGETTEAREAYRRAARALPGAPGPLVGQARAALLDDELGEALRHARAAHALAPDDPYVRLVLGEALRRAGNAEDAAPHLAAGQGATPTFEDPWSVGVERARNRDEDLVERGLALERRGRFDGALAIYDDVLSRRPDDVKVLLRRGLALMGAGRAAEAVTHFDRAVKDVPGDYDLQIARVGALRAAQLRAEARAAADAIVERWPDRARGYVARGELQKDAGQFDAALASYRRATSLDPDDLRGRFREGQLLLERGAFSDAARALLEGARRSGARPTLNYFKLTLQAQIRSGAMPAEIQATFDLAVSVHGEEAERALTRR